MAIATADVNVAVNGDIRWVGSGAGSGPYTVLELHRFLQDLADDPSATEANSDFLDITSDTPSERSTDNIVTLKDYTSGSGTVFNIDEEMAQHLYDGSISQKDGDEQYSGIVVVGSVYDTTTLQIIQNGELYQDTVHDPTFPFWGTNLNADSTANIIMRCIIKTKTGGTDIDSKKLRIQAREIGHTYAEFSVQMGLGNATAAIFTNADLNNTSEAGVIEAMDTITNQNEGYIAIDIDDNTTDEYYYSRWTRDKPTYTINELYERAKWLSRSGLTRFKSLATYDSDGVTSISIDDTDIPVDTPDKGFLRIQHDDASWSYVEYTSWTGAAFTIVSTDFSSGNGAATLGNDIVISYNALTLSASIALASTVSLVVNETYNSNALIPTSGNLLVQRTRGEFSTIAYTNYTGNTITITSTDFDGIATSATSALLDNALVIMPYNPLYGIRGELFRGITHELDVDGPTGTMAAVETITWTGGSGQLLAIDSTTAGTKIWFQLLTGSTPADNDTITGTGTVACDLTSGSLTPRTLSPCFLGQSTGSALIGSYGIGAVTTDVTYTDKLFDLTNAQITPPNNVTFTVSNIISGEDYVLVGPDTGSGAFDFDQLTLNTTLSSGGQTSVVCTASIPADTPATGTIRVQLDDDRYRRIVYTSWTGSTFTTASIDWSDPDDATQPRNIFISYIDKLADATTAEFETKFDSVRNLYVRVRDGGTVNDTPIKTFEIGSSLGSGGGSAPAIRTPDD